MRSDFSLNQIDLNLLKVFDLLMQERSVTRAAERAGRTQSAISHSLNRLREIFGDELFVKHAGSMNPTAQARELAAVITQALSDIQGVVSQHVNFKPSESQRQFRIGVTDYTSALYIPALLEEFNAKAPHARLRIVPVYLYEASELLSDPDLDCVLLGNPIIREAHVVETILARHQMLCAAWVANPVIKDLTLEKYLAMPHLQISPDGDESGVSDGALKAMGLSRRVAATVPYYMVAPKVLKGTQMIAAFADGMLSLLDESSEIVVTRPPFALPDVRVSLIYVRAKQTDAGHIWLRSCIRSIVAGCEEKKKASLHQIIGHG
ncbi:MULTISPECIES: LysR family transcriptional regulator [Sinorhizobium]|uniref:LysR family transcriptional regulator n=1 Tax=Sinorhizobium TaxID=28105 RepID=UPI0024B12155|nr:LysR family transcriptional regulator [Sinorhizobium terangae]WFU51935.1 LysR family transcriptional regulator [Sinorhizobium terangae]